MSKRAVKARINLPLGGSGAVAAVGGGGGGSGIQPATVGLTTGNTILGGTHTHQLDIAAHTGNAAAHHSPVTVTNAGLALAGQALGLSLAATSGLQIDAGLMLADSIAGEGLEIAGKVLSLGTPGGLTALTPNAGGDAHTHAVEAYASTQVSSDTYGHLLKADGFGGLALTALDVSGAADIGQALTAAADMFRVYYHQADSEHGTAHSHLVINPTAAWSQVDEQFGVDIDDSLLVRGYIVGKHALQIKDARMILHFDGPEPYETDFTGSSAGHMGQVADLYLADGGLVYRPGLFGKAAQIGVGTTNLVTRPSLESSDTTGWSTASSSTQTRSTEDAYIGQYSMKVSAGGESYAQTSFGEVAITNQPYTFSCYARNLSIPVGGNVRMLFYWTGGAQPAAGTFRTVGTVEECTGEWKRFSLTESPDYADRTGVWVYLQLYGVTADGQGFYTDCWQLEAKPYATPYCDGSMGAGHAWSNPNAPHASTSTRKGVRVTYDKVVPRDKFTVFGWFSSAYSENGSGDEWCPKFFDIGEYYGNPNVAVGKYHAATDTRTYFKDWNDSGWTDSTHGIDLNYKAGDWIFLAVVWDGSVLRVYGALLGDTALTSVTLASGDGFGVGDDLPLILGHSSRTGALYDDIAVVHRAMTEDELRAVYESNAPVFAETSTWHWRAGRNLVWADAEGFWAVDQAGDKTFAISGVDGKSWGGTTIDAGDILIGNITQGHYLHWDDSLGTLTMRGNIVVEDSTTNVDWNNVDLKPDGATRLGTGANPGGAGLWLTGDYMGYHAGGGTWPVWINKYGQFAFGNSTGTQYVKWDGSTFSIVGNGSGITSINGGNIQTGTVTATQIASRTITAGKIVSGTITANEIASKTITADRLNVTTLSAIAADLGTVTAGTVTGATIQTATTGNRVVMDGTDFTVQQSGEAVYLTKWKNSSVTGFSDAWGFINLQKTNPLSQTTGVFNVGYSMDASNETILAMYRGGVDVTLNYAGSWHTAAHFTMNGVAINGGLGVNIAYTPGAGDISAGRYLRTDGDRVYFNGNQWLRRNGTHLEWWNGSAYVQLD